jgi:hypothetical protein
LDFLIALTLQRIAAALERHDPIEEMTLCCHCGQDRIRYQLTSIMMQNLQDWQIMANALLVCANSSWQIGAVALAFGAC